jgi:hypothetical protein
MYEIILVKKLAIRVPKSRFSAITLRYFFSSSANDGTGVLMFLSKNAGNLELNAFVRHFDIRQQRNQKIFGCYFA